MAFRTNKVPAIEERTVSGSSVSFNSAFALPLKACKVSFSATQAGSGDPSPSNPRAISGVSAIGLTANSTPVSVSLGDTRYGGELDVLTGIMTITDVAYKIKDLSFSYSSTYGRFATFDYVGSRLAPRNNDTIVEGLMCECYISGRASSGSGTEYPDKRIAVAAVSSYLFIYDSSYTDVDTMKSAVGDYYVKWRLKESSYITVQLSANELSSIIGNNTFSTDAGTLEITFSDLQEKTASGSVASFNTALAMPLTSCNIDVNAWQEGSGEPSPSNVRAIHGFSALNITKTGKNLCVLSSDTLKRANGNPPIIYGDNSVTIDVNVVLAYWGLWGVFQVQANMVGLRLYLSGNISSGLSNASVRLVSSDNDGFIGTINNKTALNSGYTIQSSDIGYYFGIVFYNTIGSPQTISNIQLEVGSTATAYEPYVTPTIYPIQLGQEVYGAEVDAVNGVAHVTHNTIDLGSLYYTKISSGTDIDRYYSSGMDKLAKNSSNLLCSILTQYNITPIPWGMKMSSGNGKFYITTPLNEFASATDLKNYLSGIYMVYELAEPFDIQLTPTQIETIIGNNTIFADTGNIDLTYKDLDIAKRGSFREVFRLPS